MTTAKGPWFHDPGPLSFRSPSGNWERGNMTTETGNPNPAEMTDDELEAAQRAADGEAAGTDPAVGADPAADPDATSTAAADPAATTAAADPSADPAAPGAGGEAQPDTQTDKVIGVSSKDGTRILPYAALQAERRSARTANARAETLEEELEAAKQLIADLKAGKTPESGEVTEADVVQMEEDFPEQGKKMRALFEANKALETSRPAPAKREVETDDPVQDAIDQVPLLVEWQHGDAEKFERAQDLDRALVNSPKWRDKPAVDRFEHVAKLVAEEFDIPYPEPKTSTTPKTTPSAEAKVTAANAPRAAPNTLSDFKGGAVPDHGTADFGKMAPTQMLNRFLGMTDEEMDAQLAKLG